MIEPLVINLSQKYKVVGFDIKLLKIFANALKDLEITNAWIVNSDDGLDEISPYAKTNVYALQNGQISNIQIDPNELEIKTNGFETILGKDANYNSKNY